MIADNIVGKIPSVRFYGMSPAADMDWIDSRKFRSRRRAGCVKLAAIILTALSTIMLAVRRAAAYRAHYEHMPRRAAQQPVDQYLPLYRRLRWGQLATFHLLDTRRYRDDQACGDGIKVCADTTHRRVPRPSTGSPSATVLFGPSSGTSSKRNNPGLQDAGL
jgi:PhoD-like phosphatase